MSQLIARLLLRLFGYSIVILIALLTWDAIPAYAQSPVVRVGLWSSVNHSACPDSTYSGHVYAGSDIYDLDTFTRDSLAGEAFSNYHPEALKANAVLIRSVAEYYARHPQSNLSSLCNLTGVGFNLRSAIIPGWSHGGGALDEGLDNNVPHDRVTDTEGQVIVQNQQPLNFQVAFAQCLQNTSNALAHQGLNYVSILTDPQQGIYSGHYCGYAAQSGLSIQAAYPFRNSLTNGTSPRSLSGASQTAYVSPVSWPPRQAETYWSHSGIDQVLYRPFHQDGFYMSGWHVGDKVEYLMQFGGIYENLHLIGIADRSGPVILNIYIDGYFKRTIEWRANDNPRHLRAEKIRNISYGEHAIAIEFAEDYCVCDPYSLDTDRNVYFDVLGVNDGNLHPREGEEGSPFFSPHHLYLPLLLKYPLKYDRHKRASVE